jgi:hypothetical protein
VLLEQLHLVLGRRGITFSLQYLPQDEGKTLSCETVHVEGAQCSVQKARREKKLSEDLAYLGLNGDICNTPGVTITKT